MTPELILHRQQDLFLGSNNTEESFEERSEDDLEEEKNSEDTGFYRWDPQVTPESALRLICHTQKPHLDILEMLHILYVTANHTKNHRLESPIKYDCI